jgi:Xaa-Pro aminopeptidase
MSTGIPATRYGERLNAARVAMRERGASALLVGVGPQLRWLTGYAAMPLERLTMLVLPADGPATLVVPRLERDPAGRAPASTAGLLEIATWGETDDATLVVAGALPDGADRGRLLLSDHLWALHVLTLQRHFPSAVFGLATEALRELRAVKDAGEIALLRAAGASADRVVEAIVAGRLVGRSEADVAREIRERLIDEGHEQAAFAIVGSGPNSASPHHEAAERVLVAGEALVLDLGGVQDGYCSDTTRTLWLTGGDSNLGPTAEFRGLYDVLQRAQLAATEAVRPGVACERIDAVGRDIVAAAGWGEQFLHRTGHGIGLEVHEEPYIVAGNNEPLRVGHAFSIEPGIYLEGRYGARIEDIVVCAADGADAMNRTSRDLYIVAGT